MSEARFGKVAPTENAGRPSPRVLAFLRRVVTPLARALHRPTIEGLERLPDGPFLLVANHSGVLGISEIGSFAALFLERFGTSKPLAGFAHPFGFRIWPFRRFMRGLGAVPSTYEDAERALAAGVALLVFPGGDHEAARPVWRANRVDFGGRKGFLKIARKAGVPIVPMGIQGSHYTAPVLWRSDWLLAHLMVAPRLLGVRRYPVTLSAVLLSAAALAAFPALGALRFAVVWAIFASPLGLLPWVPWTVRMRIGAPIAATELFDGADDELERALARVEGHVQALVTPDKKA